jgi:hypothetical protein
VRWLLRITAVTSALWAVGLFGALPHVVPAQELTPLTVAMANGLAVASLAFAFAFWRASTETPPNRTVIYTAIFLLLMKTAADLYELLVLLRDTTALFSLADLVVSVALTVGIIESLPATLRPPGGAPAGDTSGETAK